MRTLLCALLSLNLVACATRMHPVDMPDGAGPPASEQLAVGNQVNLVTKDGKEMEFQVRAISDEGISGDEGLVHWQDIQALYILKSDTSTAKWVVLGVLGAVAMAWLVGKAAEGAAAASLLSCGGDC